MKIINWNIRGIGRKGFYNQVRYLISKYDPDILAFIEARVNSNRARKIIARVNFSILFLNSHWGISQEGFGYFGKLLWDFKVDILKTHQGLSIVKLKIIKRYSLVANLSVWIPPKSFTKSALEGNLLLK